MWKLVASQLPKMLLIPDKRETIVLPFEAEEVERQLITFVKPLKNMGAPAIEKKSGKFFFNGYVKGRKFSISRVIKIPQNFLPLIVGKIEATSMGCIIFIHYRLFNSPILFMSIWIGICIFIAIAFAFVLGKTNYSILALLFAAINYIVALKNFSLQLRRSKEDLDILLRSIK